MWRVPCQGPQLPGDRGTSGEVTWGRLPVGEGVKGLWLGSVVEKGSVSVRVLAGNESTPKGSGEGYGMATYTTVRGSHTC